MSYDVIIIGSGFAGSVAALRYAERGWRVLVVEEGRNFRDEDLPQTNKSLARYLFMPRLGWRGIMRMNVFRGLFVLSGAGVGGGSLVYASVLMEPSDAAWRMAPWPQGIGVSDWREELAPHYATAKRMLGVTEVPHLAAADLALKKAAEAAGHGASFRPLQVGNFFGAPPGVTVPDPYFGGAGPERRGCQLCGGCMTGCRKNAKNTLVKNYLYLAQKRGVRIEADTRVDVVRPLGAPGSGYEVVGTTRRGFKRETKTYTAERVVVAAGSIGTLKLLMRCRDELGTLAKLSSTLGTEFRTNGESLIGIRVAGPASDYSRGTAIGAVIDPSPSTQIQAVRYGAGSDVLGVLAWPWRNPFGFAKQTLILLVMQSLDTKMAFVWKRRKLRAQYGAGTRPPVHVDAGLALAERLAAQEGGKVSITLPMRFGMSLTAHPIGGCPMGKDAATGVIDHKHEVHGYPGLYVLGTTTLPANLGTNPSLTITAMAERAMTFVAPRP